MTKKNYELLALAFQNSEPQAEEEHPPAPLLLIRHIQWERCVRTVSNALKGDNPNFDPDHFRRACTFGANVRARG